MTAVSSQVAHATANTKGGVKIGKVQLVRAMLADRRPRPPGRPRGCRAGPSREYAGVRAGHTIVRGTARAFVSGGDRRSHLGHEAVLHRTLYDDVRLLRLYEGTSEIQRRLIVGSGLVRGN
ncbi:hypothetical protein GCM10023215_29880 [Pseudonocardia yuanmonensis]|uniref:Acyl-CoA dehydrogenase/oxidase C-terminal domain-containing protein n=1 Tax=Pseudonocardia yuanmonensis TaxID=1095914 RepID=A0ABP8WJW3_9PSEU